ncbi:MAG: T9SS type A sorting domain-containing protein [Saprospiraceae bacterium]|nr:T9SS type A sorting domain-containing protein [Saprospiraceae bacterium]
MRVYDLSGKLVMEQLFEKFKEQQIRIQIDGYSSGTHILQIITPDGYLTKKFVKVE